MAVRNSKTKAIAVFFVSHAIALVIVGCWAAPTAEQIARGAQLVPDVCTRCHPLSKVHSHKDDFAGWITLTNRMRTHGAQFTDADQAAIAGYLAKTQPK